MGSTRLPGVGTWLARVFVLGVAGAYSWWVATTSPFTTEADLAVVVGFGAMAALAGHTLWKRRSEPDSPDPVSGSFPDAASSAVAPGSAAAWVVVVALAAGFELACYLAGLSDRQAFPTLSSLYDSAATSTAGKGAIVFAWLALGWGLFRR
jgi:hypothetical protein